MLNHRPNTRISPDFFLTISSKDYRSATELAIHRSIKCRDPQSLNTMHNSGQNWAHSHYSLSSGCIFSVFKKPLRSRAGRAADANPPPGARAAQGLPLVVLQSSFSTLASVPAAWNLLERGSGLERGLRALQGSALGAAAWRAPGGRRRRNEGVVARSKPRGRMWRARWCPLRAR